MLRFIDTEALQRSNTLTILGIEKSVSRFESFTTWFEYAVLYYPQVADTSPAQGSEIPHSALFRIFGSGGESGEDAISVGIMLSALARFKKLPQFLWVNRLCTFHNEVDWGHLPAIYAHSSFCVVVPGRLQRSDHLYTTEKRRNGQVVEGTFMPLQ